MNKLYFALMVFMIVIIIGTLFDAKTMMREHFGASAAFNRTQILDKTGVNSGWGFIHKKGRTPGERVGYPNPPKGVILKRRYNPKLNYDYCDCNLPSSFGYGCATLESSCQKQSEQQPEQQRDNDK